MQVPRFSLPREDPLLPTHVFVRAARGKLIP
jgi:hypothetical protein